jgi:hypothetical protein
MMTWRVRVTALTLAAALICMSLAAPVHAVSPPATETPIAPPAAVFVLPASMVGGRVQVYQSPTPPPVWVADAQYFAPGGVGYEVRTFTTSAEAVSNNATMEQSFGNDRRLAVLRPTEPGEWERLGHGGYVGSTWDAHLISVQVGLSYRNVLILLGVTAKGSPRVATATGIEAAASARALRLAARLWDQARTFAQGVRAPSMAGAAFFPSGDALTLPAYLIGGQARLEKQFPDAHAAPRFVVAYSFTMPAQGDVQAIGVNVTEYMDGATARRGSLALERYVAAGARPTPVLHPLIAGEWYLPMRRIVIDKTSLTEGDLGFTYHNIVVYTVVVATQPSTARATRSLNAHAASIIDGLSTMFFQRLQMIEARSPRTPPAIARPRPVPVAPQLTVSVSVSPNPTSDGTPTSVDATTSAGAACVVSVRYASGYTAKSYSLRGAQTADASGAVSWTWTPDTKYPGPARATVSCTKGSQGNTGVGSFTVQ